jgi:hypothetical protein
VAGGEQARSDPPRELEGAVDVAVWLLARDAVERARPEAGGPGAGGEAELPELRGR